MHTHIYIDIYLYIHTHTFTHIYRSRWPPAYGWRVLFKYLIPQMLEAVDYALGMCVYTHTHTHWGARSTLASASGRRVCWVHVRYTLGTR